MRTGKSTRVLTAITGVMRLAEYSVAQVPGEQKGGDGLADMEPITPSQSNRDRPPPSSTSTGSEAFKEYVEAESDGKITIDAYHAGALAGAGEALAAASFGTADISVILTSLYPQELPVSSWIELTGAAADPSLPHGTLQESAATNEMYLGQQGLTDEYESHGLRVLSATTSPAYTLTCTPPVENLAEARGKNVRVAGEPWASEVQSLGMVSVQSTVAEVYEGLQRGVIDCAGPSSSAASNCAPSQVSDRAAILAANMEAMDKWAAILQDDLKLKPVAGDPEAIQESYLAAGDFDHEAFAEVAYDHMFADYVNE